MKKKIQLKKKNSIYLEKFKIMNLKTRIFIIFCVLLFTSSCDDLFTRFKYETYECGKNFFNLKKIFIKDYEVGDLVDVEIGNDGYQLEIIQNNEEFLIIEREEPKIEIKINKNLNDLNVNFKNHIQKMKCKNYVFKM
tara:strand:- start:1131 stop:1541 length:411 start_codon:yes stop_codon:yes gene_type:complete